jgi:phosphoadenosine phosphosulfate reductase
MYKENIKAHQNKLAGKTPKAIVKWALDHYGIKSIALSSSLGAEDQVLTDLLLKIDPNIQIFTLDTGRLPQETYDTIHATKNHYNKNIEILFPNAHNIEDMETYNGPNLFYESIEKRKLCCKMRKILPLQKKLSKLNAWICGLRKDQVVTREAINIIEWDSNFNLVKINPLANWTEKEVWDYIRKNKIPYNKLHEQGYRSIGCAPCSRAIKLEDDFRAGRWWWETPEQKECGLHMKKGIINGLS